MMIRMLFSLNLMPQQEWELKHLRSHLSQKRQSCTSAVFDNLIWFTFTRMWRGNKLFICLRAYCLMSLFENFSSFISSTFKLYISWRCRNCLSSSECLAICSCGRKDSITPQLQAMARRTFELDRKIKTKTCDFLKSKMYTIVSLRRYFGNLLIFRQQQKSRDNR